MINPAEALIQRQVRAAQVVRNILNTLEQEIIEQMTLDPQQPLYRVTMDDDYPDDVIGLVLEELRSAGWEAQYFKDTRNLQIPIPPIPLESNLLDAPKVSVVKPL